MKTKLSFVLLSMLFASGADAVTMYPNTKAPLDISPVPYVLAQPPNWTDFPNPITLAGASISGIFAGQTSAYNYQAAGSWTYPAVQQDMYFEEILSLPTPGPLTLVGQGANQNIGGQDIFPVYPGTLFGQVPQTPGMGTGAFSILFDSNVTQFGLDIVGANYPANQPGPPPGDPGEVKVQFFRDDGSLLDTLTFTAFNGSVWFLAGPAEGTFRGVTITNDDYNGLGYTAFRVPVPAPIALLVLGFGVMAWVSRTAGPCRSPGVL